MSNADDDLNHIQDRPYSIDLSLELERQLDNESLPPPTPADPKRPQSLDPQVLAHIITDLTSRLADATRNRDELARSLSETQTKEKELTDVVSCMTNKCATLQEELEVAKTKARDDEDTISVLRTKVEESRRGLMRLQSESRRHSQLPSGLDISRANLASLAAPQTSKRASFAPLTGASATVRINSHRRISSVSDSGFPRFDSSSPHGSPGPTNVTFPDHAMLANKLASLPKSPIAFGRTSPPPSALQFEESAEIEMLRKELASMRQELDDAKHELNEVNEAREASELCVKALRMFIEDNNVGVPVPNVGGPSAAAPSQTVSKRDTQNAGGWGFKLWRTEPLAKSPSGAAPIPVIPPTPVHSIVSSTPPQPLTRKLGEFFGARRTSVSSTTPVKSPRAEHEILSNRLSDASSIEESLAEPVSPASELPRPSVLVRDSTSVTSTSSARDIGASPEGKIGGLPSPSGEEEDFAPVAI